ncbi:hypothetical protein [Pseudomonas sp. St316]|uniref:hypothetical protein n=1 Tax=Pseudomonas sp. St316 TaxID=2678257 RepID=UPI0020179EA0|nr:hypothetical protein [Pseudomonas sp. St316]
MLAYWASISQRERDAVSPVDSVSLFSDFSLEGYFGLAANTMWLGGMSAANECVRGTLQPSNRADRSFKQVSFFMEILFYE